MSVFIKKVTTQNYDELFILSDREDQKEIRLHILNIKEHLSYFGVISDIQLRSMAAELRMMYNVYTLETTNALAGENNEAQYNYALETVDGTYIFKWKKVVENESIKINLGEVTVERKNFDSALSEMLSFMSGELIKHKTNDEAYCFQIHEGQKSIAETTSLLDETLTSKEKLEKELYTKFAIILNAKKRKIRELIDTIEELKNSNSRKRGNKVNKDKSNCTTKSEISYADMNEAGPSVEKCKRNLDSSFQFDDNNELSKKPNKQRVRKKVEPIIFSSNATVSSKRNKTEEVVDSDEDVDAMLEDF